MRRALFLLLALGLTSTPLFAGSDFVKKGKSEAAAPAPAKPMKMTDQKKKIEELKKELNGSEWQVQMSSGGKDLDKDTFTFQNNQVTCKTLADKGYPPTNYTISMPEGADMATWETMQTSSKGQVVFIRGEWKEGVMRGVMSEQLEEGKSKDYNFTSLSKAEVPASTEEKAVEKPAETAPESSVLTSGPVEPSADEAPGTPGLAQDSPLTKE